MSDFDRCIERVRASAFNKDAAEYMIRNAGEPMSARLVNGLLNENCVIIDDAVKESEAYWLRCANFGKVSLSELKKLLWKRGLYFGFYRDTDSNFLEASG
jgi:DNA-directed RNA polymerase alpha subunit